jgi:putative redox protein
MTEEKITAAVKAMNTANVYTTQISINEHEFIADEPVEIGGTNLGPSPENYLCAALASCTAITLRMYAQRKNWMIKDIGVDVEFIKANKSSSGKNTFNCTITVTGDLNEEQNKRLLEIANACPVHRLLKQPSDVFTSMA